MNFKENKTYFPKKFTYPTFVAVFFSVGWGTMFPAFAGNTPLRPNEGDFSQPIAIATQGKSYPYSFVDKDGKLKGFAVDISDAVARTMGLTFHRLVTDIPVKMLEKGEVKMVQFLAETGPRQAKVAFSVPILRFETVVVVRENETRIRSLKDLNGMRVGVGPRGTVGDEFLTTQHPEAQRIYFPESYDGIRLLGENQLDAAVMSRITAISTMERMGVDAFKILEDSIHEYEIRYCFAVAHGNTQLLARLNEGLDILHRTGEFDEIQRRWFSRYQSHHFTSAELTGYGAGILGIVAILATLAFIRQRKLLRRIAGQGQELSEQRSLLGAYYDKHPMATLVLELTEGSCPLLISMNAQAQLLFGLDPIKSLGKEVEELDLNVESRQIFDEALIRWKRTMFTDPWELTLDETHRIIENALISLGDTATGGKRIGLLITDVTHRRQIEHGLAQARRLEALGAMVGGIAHEFNNLLMPIVTTVETLREVCTQANDHFDELQIIENAATRAAELTRRLLSFGRKGEATQEPIQVSEIVSNCLALIRPICDRQIEWETDIQPALLPISFNQTDLNQILLNLIINARDALEMKLAQIRQLDVSPRITIRVKELPTEIFPRPKDPQPRGISAWQKVTVEDTGQGIPPELIDRIFEPFFTTKEVGKGTGLGLATVWQLVTEAGGTITVESTVGIGTRFHVFLPRYKVDGAIPAACHPTVHSSEVIRKMNILFVEDEPLLARSSSRGLKRFGHQVTIATDGAEAWKLFENGKGEGFEILVIDINMPHMNGIELTERVRAAGYKGRIFLMSGRMEAIDSSTLLPLRVERVLVKPFMISTLVEAIENPPDGIV